jgi:hypothetical protein
MSVQEGWKVMFEPTKGPKGMRLQTSCQFSRVPNWYIIRLLQPSAPDIGIARSISGNDASREGKR